MNNLIKKLEKQTVSSFCKKLRKTVKKTLQPKEQLSLLDWAEKYYKLSSEDSSEPGHYRSSRAPYQREILNMIDDPNTNEIVIMTNAQGGKTLSTLITLGYHMHQQPCPILFVLPGASLGNDFSKRRLAPAIRNTPVLKDLFKNQDATNTITSKHYDGGSLYIASAGIPDDLTSRPIRLLLLDEVDKYPASTKDSGDPVLLAKQRTVTFRNRRKIILTSTPLIKGTSRIEIAYENSSQGYYVHQCMHCDEFFQPTWEMVKYTPNQPQTALLYCNHCGAGHDDNERLKGMVKGKVIHKFPDRKVKGIHVNALSSPWCDLSDLVEEYIQATANPSLLQQFVNEKLGLPYEIQGKRVDDVLFGDRKEDYTPSTLPNDILVLTAGADVQTDRIEIVVTGWGENYENWNVDYIVINGSPTDPDTWNRIHHTIQSKYTRLDGVKLKIKRLCIDTGGNTTSQGGFSQYVKDFTTKYHQFGYLPIKGSSYSLKSIFPFKRSKSSIYFVDTIKAKDMIYTNLRISDVGPGYTHFPTERDNDFFNQLTSEERKTKKGNNGRTTAYYERIGSRAAEVLDCTVYALCAYISLGPKANVSAIYQINKQQSHPEPPPDINIPDEPPKVKNKYANWRGVQKINANRY